MDVYLIRHGETEYNKKHRHQSADIPLTELGKKQAASLTSIVRDLNPTHIISSPYKRASETAEIASGDGRDNIQHNDFFVEIKRPVHIVGRSHFSLVSIFYVVAWFLSKNEFYQDEKRGESRLAFLNRLHDAKEYLESLPQDARVIVFSHSIFINYFVKHICDERPISFWKTLLLLLKIRRLDNSSLTHVMYNPDFQGNICRWQLISFDIDGHVVKKK